MSVDMTDDIANQWADAAADKRWFLICYKGA